MGNSCQSCLVLINISFDILKLTCLLIVLTLKLIFEYLRQFIFLLIKVIKSVITLKNVLIALKALCFVSLIYSAVLLTFDYLSYPSIFKLNVINNINGFDLPPISFCTETHVLFDKNKIISFYNWRQEFQEFRVEAEKRAEEEYEKHYQRLAQFFERNFILRPINHYLKPFFDEKQKNILNDLSFDEMKGLMIRANEVINCSAKLHFRYDSNQTLIKNCSQSIQVLESIYGNQDFGICFTFFDWNDGYYLKDDDYIRFQLSYENGPDLFSNPYFESEARKRFAGIYFDDYSVLYLSVHQKIKDFEPNKYNSIKISRQGLEGRLKMFKTSVGLLSAPYMEKCDNYGKSLFYQVPISNITLFA